MTEAAKAAELKKNPLENPSLCELENVHKVYNEIANHFSETRHSPWPRVNEFIQQFEMGSVLVDIGCGNGKYLPSNRNIFEVAKKFGFFFCLIFSVSVDFCKLNHFFFLVCRLAAIEVKAY